MGILAVAALTVRTSARRLSPRPVMLLTSGLLATIAVMLTGKGVHALQQAGFASVNRLPGLPDVGALGLFGTAETLAAQVLLTAALVGSALGPIRSSLRQQRAEATAAK